MPETKKFYNPNVYYLRHDAVDTLIVGKSLSVEDLSKIVTLDCVFIWDNQGLYRLIPTPVLRNAWIEHHGIEQYSEVFQRKASSVGQSGIRWSQGVDVPQEVVAALLSSLPT